MGWVRTLGTSNMLSGELKIHKKVETRPAKAVSETNSGSLRVWDSLPDGKWIWKEDGMIHKMPSTPHEPDIIVSSDEWTRVEREGHSWKMTNMESLRELAERREDVDEDELPDSI